MKIKRFLRNALIGLVVLIVLIWGFVYFQKDALIKKIIDTVADSYSLDISYSDASLSLFRDFPDISFSIHDLNAKHEADTLAKLNRLSVGVNLPSLLWKDAYKINSIELSDLHLKMVCRDSADCNFPTFAEAEEVETEGKSEPLNLEIKDVSLKGIHIQYDDYFYANHYAIKDLNAEIEGTITGDEMTFALRQNKGLLYIEQADIIYAKNWQLEVAGDLSYNQSTAAISTQNISGSLNELKWMLKGDLLPKEDTYQIKADFKLQETEIKPLLSLIPAYYTDDFEDIETSGSLDLNASANGDLDLAKENYPAFNMQLNIDNGSIQYPSYPSKLQDIFAHLKVDKEQGNLDLVKADLSDLKLKIGVNSFLEGEMAVSYPISKPYIKADFITTADLKELSQAVPLSGIDQLTGLLNGKADIDLDWSELQKGNNKAQLFETAFTISDLSVQSSSYPALKLQKLDGTINEKSFKITADQIQAGSSSIETAKMESSSDRFLLDEDSQLKFNVIAMGKKLDLNEWMESSEATSEESDTDQDYTHLPNLKMGWDLSLEELLYDSYQINNLSSTGNYSPDLLKIGTTSLTYEESTLSGNGEFTNLEAYLNKKGKLNGRMNLNGGAIDLDQFMEEETETSAAATESTTAARFPEDISLDMDINLKGLKYGSIDLSNLKGRATLENGILSIPNAVANSLGGEVGLEGSYTAKTGQPVSFDFQLAGNRFSYGDISKTLPVVGKIAPLIEYIEGTLNTRLSLSGELTEDYSPSYNQLSVQGFMETFNGLVKGHPIMKKVNGLLQKPFLKEIPLQNTKNWVTVEDGVFIVEPFKTNIRNEEWQVEGQHELEGEMNYTLSGPMSIEQLRGSKLGDQILDQAQGILNKIPLTEDYELKKVDVIIDVKGKATDPKVGIRLSPKYKEQLESRIQSKVDEVKETVRDSLNQAKEELEEDLKDEKDKLEENIKKEANDKLKEILTGKKDSSSVSTVDSLTKAAEEKAKKLKKKLNKWNPFKKKN